MEVNDSDDKKDFKQNLCGYVYQVKLLLLFLWRGFQKKNCKKFQLGTELGDAEKFDDAVFFYEKDDGSLFVRYMQAKHASFEGGFLKYADFVSDWYKAKCNLKKYFISYRKIIQRKSQCKIDDLILCTNNLLENLILKKDNTNELTFIDVTDKKAKDIFYDSKTKKSWNTYQLKDIKKCNELKNKLYGCTNLKLLANEFAIYLFKEENDPNLDFKNYWISAYFNVLMEEKIIKVQEIYRLKEENSNAVTETEIRKNNKIKEFRKDFVELWFNKKGYRKFPTEMIHIYFQKDFVKNLPKKKQKKYPYTPATIKETAEVLVEHVTGGANPVLDKYFENIYHFLKYKKEYVFTKEFIDNTIKSSNAKDFRSELEEACKRFVAKDLEKHQLFAPNATNTILGYAQSPPPDSIDVSEEERLAKKIIDHIFYKTDLSNVFEPSHLFLKDVFEEFGSDVFKFTNEFARNTNAHHHHFRTLFMKLYIKEKFKTAEILFKQKILELSQLVKEIIKLYKNANKNEKVLRFDKTTLFNFSGLLEALNGSVFASTEERKLIEFRNINHTSVEFAADFKTELKSSLLAGEINDLMTYKIEYINYPPYFDELKEYRKIEEDIKEFLELLVFVITPNETNLMKNISYEMGEKFNLLDSDTITNDFFQKILNWAKKREETFLTGKDAEAFMSDIEENISIQLEAGCNLQYFKKLEEYSVSYNRNLVNIISFIRFSSKQILHLQTKDCLLTTLKVAQTLKYIEYVDKNFKALDNLIFNPLTSLLRMEFSFSSKYLGKYVSNAFGSKINLLIIVDKKTEYDVKSFCQILFEILQNNPRKKIVIISDNDSSLISEMDVLGMKKLFSEKTDTTTFDDLMPISQLKIRENTQITFQGNNVSLKDLINERDCNELIDSQTLQGIICGNKLTIGEPLETLSEEEKSYYRSRKFRKIEFNNKIFENEKAFGGHVFAIEGKKVAEFLIQRNVNLTSILPLEYDFNFEKTVSVYVILNPINAEKEFCTLCKSNNNIFMHWLKLCDNRLIWKHSYIPYSSTVSSLTTVFENCIKKEDDEGSFFNESLFLDHIKQSQIIIIADKAGIGKTTILKKFAKSLSTSLQWKIKINLNQHTDTLSKINRLSRKNNSSDTSLIQSESKLNLNFDNFDKTKNYGNLVLESLINKKMSADKNLSFENRILNHFFTSREMLIMFDGFDEINPDYGDIVLDLLQILKNDVKNKIWITSRTNFKHVLEEKFNTISYDMKTFDKNDQEIFLMQFWMTNWKRKKGYDIPNRDSLAFYTRSLVKEASYKIRDIIGIPLQTKMLAEVFQEKSDGKEKQFDDKLFFFTIQNTRKKEEHSWTSCFEYVKLAVKPKSLNFFKKLNNIFTLYEDFFNRKIGKHYLYEKGILNPDKPDAENVKYTILKDKHKGHKILGLFEFYDENLNGNLLTRKEKQRKDICLASYKNGTEIAGIAEMNNGSLTFNHVTYAEYFAACYLAEKLWKYSNLAKQIFEAVNEIFKRDVPVFGECILYLLKQEMISEQLQYALNGISLLKFVAKHGLLNCINVFLASKDFNDNFPNADESGKTILHYAVKYEQFDVVIYITLYIYNFILRRSDYQYTSLHTLSKYILNENEPLNITVSSQSLDFLNDICISAKNFLMSKQNEIMGRIINKTYKFHMTKKNLVSHYSEMMSNDMLVSICDFMKQTSFKTVISVLKFLKSISLNKWTIDFIDDVCSRPDMNEDEKLDIFELICNQITDFKKRINFVEKIFILVVQNDCSNILNKMLQKYANIVSDQMKVDCYNTACKSNMTNIIESLLPQLKKVNKSKNWFFNFHPFYNALRYDSTLEIIKRVYETTNASINGTDADGRTPLLIALQRCRNPRKIEFLIERGADPTMLDKNNKSPWIFAVEKNYDEVIKLFIKKCRKLESAPLRATMDNFYLNTRSFKKDYLEKNGQTLLHQAITTADILLCKFLLQKGANVHLLDAEGKSPIYRACEKNLFEIVKWLLLHGASYNEEGIQKLDTVTEIKNILQQCASNFEQLQNDRFQVTKNKYIRNATNKEKQTLWHIAAKSNILENIFQLSYLKKTINNKDCNGNTALNIAIENKNEKMVIKLKAFGAFLTAETPYKLFDSELQHIVSRKTFRRKKEFFDVNNAFIKYSKHALHYAAENNHIKFAQELLNDYCLDINDEDDENHTALYYAVKCKHLKMTKYLLQNGANFDATQFKDLFWHENKCILFIQRIENCFKHVYNEDFKALKNEMELINNKNDFKVIINAKDINKKTLLNYSENNYDLTLYLLLNHAAIPLKGTRENTISAAKNLRIRKAMMMLKQLAIYEKSDKIDPSSLKIYRKQHFIKMFGHLFFQSENEIASKIGEDFFFNYEKPDKTHKKTYILHFPIGLESTALLVEYS